MRTIATVATLLAIVSIAATAEPPPLNQNDAPATASAPAVTVADAGQAKHDTTAAPAVAYDTVKAADNDGHHGWLWWALLIGFIAIIAAVAYRYFTRKPEPTYTARSGFEPPDPSEKRPKNHRNE